MREALASAGRVAARSGPGVAERSLLSVERRAHAQVVSHGHAPQWASVAVPRSSLAWLDACRA